MAKKKTAKPKEKKIVTPKKPEVAKVVDVEKIKVVDISQPTPAELKLEIAALSARLDRIVETLSKSKSVKGM